MLWRLIRRIRYELWVAMMICVAVYMFALYFIVINYSFYLAYAYIVMTIRLIIKFWFTNAPNYAASSMYATLFVSPLSNQNNLSIWAQSWNSDLVKNYNSTLLGTDESNSTLETHQEKLTKLEQSITHLRSQYENENSKLDELELGIQKVENELNKQ